MIDVASLACPACGGIEFTTHRGLTMRLGGKVILLPSVQSRECLGCEKETLMPDAAEQIEKLMDLVFEKGDPL